MTEGRLDLFGGDFWDAVAKALAEIQKEVDEKEKAKRKKWNHTSYLRRKEKMKNKAGG